MSTTFIQSLQDSTGLTRTENGAVTNSSSLDPVVDFFGLAGAKRHDPEGAADLFEKAFRAEPQTAIRTLFYLRDVRGGQGERDVFKACFRGLLALSPAKAARVLKHIPFFGRWDDLFFDGSELVPGVEEIIGTQWDADVAAYERGDGVSLMAKWLPSDKTGSTDPERTELAINVRKALGLSQREYRQTLSALRERIGLLEQHMSSVDWGSINYGALPAQAHRKHVAAFRRNDGERYQAYLDSVERGEAKINTSTLYPHELYNLVQRDERAANVMWENLPDYTRPGQDALVMADVSGSMWRQPISVSVSLALYFAERNTGPYQGYFMTFDTNPKLVHVEGGNLRERLYNIEHSTTWFGTTNIVKAFAAILDAGMRSGVVPATLYIVSDMEFDVAVEWGRGHSGETVFEATKHEFAKHGFNMPHVVFWNVDARNDQVPATILDGAVTLVSGLSPTVFAMAVEGKSPRELVDDVVNGERYTRVEVY